MDQEVEEVSFLPGEAILNKKAVYEPTKGQRFRQVVCSRGWAVCILLTMGAVMVAISVIAAFARPATMFSGSACPNSDLANSSASSADADGIGQEDPQTYIARNGEPFPWRDLRLPKTIIPESYNIFLHANISESFFTGKVRMTLKIVSDTDFIVFHAIELNVTNLKIFEGEGNSVGALKELDVLKVLEYPRNEMFFVKVAALLKADTHVQLEADFRGSLASLSQMKGFYKSSYTINGKERFMASTQFQATDARRAFPCLDEPNLKAKFAMSMVRDQGHITLFNTPLKSSNPYTGDLILDEYEETVKMSTYLVAFVVCDFKNISKITRGGIRVRVFAPEDKIYMGRYALDAAVTILDHYNSFFGVPYPLPKQDLIAIPNFAAGAMENWGLITYRDTSILYDPAVSTEQDKKWVATVVAHELAHQWFGNLVTMEWWNDLWLNEGFASFVENIGADVVDKDFHMMDTYMDSFFDAQYEDSLVSSHPIEVPVHDPVEIEAVFDRISYGKGAALIRMLENVLGNDHFRAGLTAYLNKHAYGNAKTSDLWQAIQDAGNMPSDLTVSEVMNTWTRQMNYPVVTVTRQQGRLMLTQERFLLRDDSSDIGTKKRDTKSPYGYKWNIPFTYTTSAGTKKSTLVWMKMGSAQVDIADNSDVTWVKGNVDTQGFYRVNYDKAGWQAIINQLSADHTVFTVSDRMGLIDDAFSLARAGLIDYSVPLDISKYLINETDYFVWSTALTHIGFLKERLFLMEEYDLLTVYVLCLAQPLIDVQGWENKEKHLEANMQALMIAEGIQLEYQPVIDKAVEIFKQWQENESIKMSNGLRGIIYGTGIKYGKKADWDLVFERYRKEVIPSEQQTLLASLSTPCDARILQILLEYSLDDSKIKSQDTGKVIQQVAHNHNGRLLSWRFFRENWDAVYDRYGGGSFLLSGMVKGVTTGFNTQFDYDEIAAFFMNKRLGSAKMALDQALEVVQSHIDWAQVNLETVKNWLRKSAPPKMEIM